MFTPFDNDPSNLAYQLFLMSGNPGYYMFYNDLKDQSNKENRD